MNPAPDFPPVRDLVLHQAPMLLIERVLHAQPGMIEVSVDPAHSAYFADAQGRVPAWVGLEYMAQTISAYAGLVVRERGQAPRIGFLLGTRAFRSQVTHFQPEVPLRVRARQEFHDDNHLVLFDCQIVAGQTVLASAQVKAIQPDDPETLLKEIT